MLRILQGLPRLLLFVLIPVLLGCTDDDDGSADHADIRVVVLADTAYVDFAVGDPAAKGSNLLASFRSLGYDALPLTRFRVDSLRAALQGAQVFVIAQEKSGATAWSDRPAGLDTVITEFVRRGGMLVKGGPIGNLLDTLFDWHVYATVSPKGGSQYRFQPGLAAGTPLAGGPDLLPFNNLTARVWKTRLPPGALAPWRNDSLHPPMFVAPVEQGWVVWLGWDWFDAAPTGGLDGGWLAVLDRLDRFVK